MNNLLESSIIYAAVAAAVAADAWAQGGITLRNRKYVPPSEQAAVNRDHHVFLATTFFLTAGAAVALAVRRWEWIYVAALLRLALFDPLLNLRKGDPLFATGTSARLDKLLSRAPYLNPFLRVAALVGSVALLTFSLGK